MSYTTIWVHAVFSTKNRNPLLHRGIRFKVYQHILDNANKKNIWIDCIGGYDDHVHILISLGRTQNLADVIQLIKGESSRWINANKLCSEKFAWQDDYFAISVSHSLVNIVRKYIHNQEEHHKTVSFADENAMFIQRMR